MLLLIVDITSVYYVFYLYIPYVYLPTYLHISYIYYLLSISERSYKVSNDTYKILSL